LRWPVHLFSSSAMVDVDCFEAAIGVDAALTLSNDIPPVWPRQGWQGG
jgi:hypothetical protein